jgi:hypothetical protein
MWKKNIIENDYQYGRKREADILDKMNDFFKDNIKQTSFRYDTKDYVGDNFKYEVKSRRNDYNAFPTTIIPTDKINQGTNYIFLFNFQDGLYYIPYEEKLFKTFKIDIFYRRDGGQNNPLKLYWYIPIENLKQII